MTREDQSRALALARQTIDTILAGGAPPPAPALADDDVLAQPGACFVTLTKHGQLRGCIGSLAPQRALAADIIANAAAAAFRDPRFAPLGRAEWPATRVQLSVLGPQQALARGDRQQLLAQLRVGRDGLVIEGDAGQRATFLPSVWTQLPSPAAFLDQLKAKAGLPADYDERRLSAWRYNTESFGEDTE